MDVTVMSRDIACANEKRGTDEEQEGAGRILSSYTLGPGAEKWCRRNLAQKEEIGCPNGQSSHVVKARAPCDRS
jgi:hypothetical protein